MVMTPTSLQRELIQSTIDCYYNVLAENGYTLILGRDYSKFELVDGRLRLKTHSEADLIIFRTGKLLALSLLATRGGRNIIRGELGFVDWQQKPQLPSKAIAALQLRDSKLGEAAVAVTAIEQKDVGQIATDVLDIIKKMETTLAEAKLNEILDTINDPPLTLLETSGTR